MSTFGHRGAKGERPENTLLGINWALQNGVGAIEIDLHLSKDGIPVVIHDPTVDRTTNGKGKILDMTYAEISKLDAGNGEKVPTFYEVIEIIKKNDVTFFVEIKSGGLEKIVIEEILKHKLEKRTYVISFHHRLLKFIKEKAPQIKTAPLILGLPVNPVQMIKETKADGISICALTVDKDVIKECKEAGFMVAVWVANSKEEYHYFNSMGADFIGTDFPAKLA